MNGNSASNLQARRPSKLNSIADHYHGSSIAADSAGSAGSGVNPPALYESSRSYALRLPSLFRTRIPLIAVLPFFLLGFLFAPVQKFDPDAAALQSSSVHPNDRYQRPAALHRTADGSRPLDDDGGESHDGASNPAGAFRAAVGVDQLGNARYDRSGSFGTGAASGAGGKGGGGGGWAQRFLPGALTGGSSKQGDTLNEHYTEEDGLLYFPPAAAVNDPRVGVPAARASQPKQRHPILYLMEDAERKWEELLDRQSTTLEAAAQEYTRRYKRAPPAGFDKWWQFAQKNNIQLVDEYDSINRDFEPFYALPPDVYRKRNEMLASDPDLHFSKESFTLNVVKGKIEITGPFKDMSRAADIKDLLDPLAEYLPDMHFTFTSHDGPGIIMSGEGKKRYIEVARAGRVLREDEFETIHNPAEHPGFTAACPPNSNWRKSLFGWSLPKPSTHSFITSVQETSDVCKHPNIASQHGFFLWNGPYMGPLYPLFTWAKTAVHSDILVTPLEQYYLPVGPDPEWDEKRFNKLLWRGSNTGAAFNRESRWRSSQRARLVFMTSETHGNRAVHWADQNGALRASTEPVVDLNERYTDVGFAGRPAQCDEGDGTCDALLRVFEWKGNQGQEEANHYKYIFDMDGNGWSGRFHRLMMSNSAVLKSTIMPEWYQDRIMPWVHFIPVKVDYTDLYDILAFFIGGPEGQNGHDSLGKKIALQGQEWAKHHWREVDMQSYMFRLLLEHARLLNRSSDNLKSADFVDASAPTTVKDDDNDDDAVQPPKPAPAAVKGPLPAAAGAGNGAKNKKPAQGLK